MITGIGSAETLDASMGVWGSAVLALNLVLGGLLVGIAVADEARDHCASHWAFALSQTDTSVVRVTPAGSLLVHPPADE